MSDRNGMPSEEELYALQNASNGIISGFLKTEGPVTSVRLDLHSPGKLTTIAKVPDKKKCTTNRKNG